MMKFSLALLAAAMAGVAASQTPKLTFEGDKFVVKVGAKSFSANLAVPTTPPFRTMASALYRKDDAFVVWDVRGLNIRKGDKVITETLQSAPYDARMWSASALTQHRLLAQHSGYRPAPELLDHRRFGSKVYLLFRFQTPMQSPWFDALYVVDMSAAKIAATPLAHFDETQPLGDGSRLIMQAGAIAVIDSTPDTWSVAFVDEAGKTKRKTYDGRLLEARSLEANKLGFVESVGASGSRIGVFDLVGVKRDDLAESVGRLGFLDAETPLVAWESLDKNIALHNLSTGALTAFDLDVRLRRCGPYAVAYKVSSGPVEATLYALDRMTKSAVWRRPATKSKPTSKSVVKPPTRKPESKKSVVKTAPKKPSEKAPTGKKKPPA